MKTVLVPTDGSATAAAAGRFARDIAQAEDARVVVVGVVQPVMVGGFIDEAVTEAIAEHLRADVDALVAELSDIFLEATGQLVTDDHVEDGILKAAFSAGADMIIMGTHGRTGLSRAILGSVADRVLRASDIPVVFVPMKGSRGDAHA